MWLTDKNNSVEITAACILSEFCEPAVCNDERQVNINTYLNAERKKHMGKKVQGVDKASWKLQR